MPSLSASTKAVPFPVLLPVLIMGLAGTTVVMIVTGTVSQGIIRRGGKEKGHE